MKKITTIDAYIASFPKEVQAKLIALRETIRKAAPEATEAMKYGIPTFVLKKNLVHFGAYESHIGFYPAPSGIRAFAKDLAKYKHSKGAVQFPLNEPLPLPLIRKIVTFRVTENLAQRSKLGAAQNVFPYNLPSPAQRALIAARIRTLKDLTRMTEFELSLLHGMGPKAIEQIKSDLLLARLSLKK